MDNMKKIGVLLLGFVLISIMVVSTVSAEEIWIARDGFTSVNWVGGGGESGKSGNGCLYGGTALDVGGHNSYCQTKSGYIPNISDYENVQMSISVRYEGHSSGWDESGDRILFYIWDGSNWQNIHNTPWSHGNNYQNDGKWHKYTFSIPDSYITEDFRIKILQDSNEEGKEDASYDNIILTGDESCVIYSKPSTTTLYDESGQNIGIFNFGVTKYITRVVVNWRNIDSEAGCDAQVWFGGVYEDQINNIDYGGQTNTFNVNAEAGDIKIDITDHQHESGRSCEGVTINSIEVYSNNCTHLDPPDAYWADMLGVQIDSADKDDSVKLVVPGFYESDDVIDYTVYRDIPWWFDSKTVQYSSLGFSVWTAGKKQDGSYNDGNFYFHAEVNNSEKTSDDLNVSDSEDNSLPVALITNPIEEGEIYRNEVNIDIDFEQASYDIDDDLLITWNFGDGTSDNFDYCQTDNVCNTEHSYNNNGVYVVSLTAKEMERTQRDTDYVVIEILQEGINVMPKITEPLFGIGYGNIVSFNANESYVANCTFGNCPAGETCFVAGSLNCTYIHAPGELTTGSDYELEVEWTFPSDPEVESVIGNWSADLVQFTKFFPKAGEHEARLRLIYEEL